MSILPPGHEAATVHVDVAGLADLAAKLRLDVDQQLRPYIGELIRTYNYGVGFAHGVPGPNAQVARAHYNDVLAQIVNQLQLLAWGGAVLADAARRVADRYGDADGLAAAKVEDVKAILALASRSIPQAQPLPSNATDSHVANKGLEAL